MTITFVEEGELVEPLQPLATTVTTAVPENPLLHVYNPARCNRARRCCDAPGITIGITCASRIGISPSPMHLDVMPEGAVTVLPTSGLTITLVEEGELVDPLHPLRNYSNHSSP